MSYRFPCSILSLALIATAPAQSVELRSAYLTEKVATAHRVRVTGTIGGAAVIELDPNACTVGPFGDAGTCTEIAPTRVAVAMKQAKVADPMGSGRSLFNLTGEFPDGVRMWFVTRGKTASARLIVQDGASGRIVVPLLPAAAVKAAPAAEQTRTVDAGGLELTVPATWVSEEPSSSMRTLQMKVPGADDKNAELVVFRFGRSDIDANIQRWAAQFDQVGREMSVKTGQCARGEYTLVQITGASRASGRAEPNTGVLHVILPDERAMYFVKLIGPKQLVQQNADALRRAFGGDKSTERSRD